MRNVQIFEIKAKQDYDNLKRIIVELGNEFLQLTTVNERNTEVLIDHVFPVKGIGTVILGIVKQGEVHSGQMLEITGYESAVKKVIIRSIQKHDRNFKVAYEGDRVGLALKGNISPRDVSRDNIIVTPGIFKQEKEIEAEVFVSQFYKPKSGKIKSNDGFQYYGLIKLKLSPFKFIEGQNIIPGKSGPMKIRFDKSVLHNGEGLKGIITELNRFENRLRIVGYFQQTKK